MYGIPFQIEAFLDAKRLAKFGFLRIVLSRAKISLH